jgi:hypothetical protein
MLPTLFTVESANGLLPRLRPLMEWLATAYDEVLCKREEMDALLAQERAGESAERSMAQLSRELGRLVARLETRIEEVSSLGVVLKDAREGQVDFPATLQGQPIYLCWQLGEDRVGFWHGSFEGFCPRRPLDQLRVSTVH